MVTGSGQRSHEAEALGTSSFSKGNMREVSWTWARGSSQRKLRGPKAGTGSDLLRACLSGTKPEPASHQARWLSRQGRETIWGFMSADSLSEVKAELWEESTDRRWW